MRRLPDDPPPGSLDERFSELLDGRLAPADEAELRARLRQDPALAREFEQFRKVVEALRRTPQEELPPALRQRILAAAATTPAPAPLRSVGSRVLPVVASLLTAAAAVLLFFLMLPIERAAPARVHDLDVAKEKEGVFRAGEVRQEEDLDRDAEKKLASANPPLREALGREQKEAGPGELPVDAKAESAPQAAAKVAVLGGAPGVDREAPGEPAPQERTAAGEHRLSVLMITVADSTAEAFLEQALLPLDVAYLPPRHVFDNRIGPVSPEVSGALDTLTATRAAGAAGAPTGGGGRGYGEDSRLVRLRGSRDQVREVVVALQGEASRFRPQERTIEGVAARELQSTPEWTRLRQPVLDLGEQLEALAILEPESKSKDGAEAGAAKKGGAPGAAQKPDEQADSRRRQVARDESAQKNELGVDEFAKSTPKSRAGSEQGFTAGRAASGPSTPGPSTPGARGAPAPGQRRLGSGPPVPSAVPDPFFSRPADLIDYYLLVVFVRRPR